MKTTDNGDGTFTHTYSGESLREAMDFCEALRMRQQLKDLGMSEERLAEISDEELLNGFHHRDDLVDSILFALKSRLNKSPNRVLLDSDWSEWSEWSEW